MDCNSIHSIWKSACSVFMLTENGVTKTKKIICLQSWKLFSNSSFLLFAGLCFSLSLKIHKLICHNLSWHCNLWPGFSSDGVTSIPMFGWYWEAGLFARRATMMGQGRGWLQCDLFLQAWRLQILGIWVLKYMQSFKNCISMNTYISTWVLIYKKKEKLLKLFSCPLTLQCIMVRFMV